MPKIAIPHEFLDAYTSAMVQDPVSADDGFVYDRAFIKAWIENKGTSPKLVRR